jgi:hypothetical protein
MTAWQVCRSSRIGPRLDLGWHPVSSFFLPTGDAPETVHRLMLEHCADCGTIQLAKPVPHAALKAPYDWLFAREPEEHLDDRDSGPINRLERRGRV